MDSDSTPEDGEVEEMRRESIATLNAEEGPEWVDRYKPGTFGCHELLDRTSLLADAVAHQILSHPSCLSNREWYALADRAATALCELYQRIGAEHL